MEPDKKMFAGWWLWILGLAVLAAVVFGILDATGIIGRTIVEREVFERSFQYQEARKTEIATYEAQLAELRAKLKDPDLNNSQHAAIESQIDALEVRLRVAKEKSQ